MKVTCDQCRQRTRITTPTPTGRRLCDTCRTRLVQQTGAAAGIVQPHSLDDGQKPRRAGRWLRRSR